ncbi:Per1-like-domain-containing protein [Xylaria telfairii]|nr:Per1-like-domain-containing protein [Xylaria telfairii]
MLHRTATHQACHEQRLLPDADDKMLIRPTTSRHASSPSLSVLPIGLIACLLLLQAVDASAGDRLPEFRECVKVCNRENCDPNNDPTPIPLHHRLLLWTCAQECDYTCQHIVTTRRVAAGQAVTQFHGKWPFERVLGLQEPASVLFSVGNLAAHRNGLARLRERVPATYPLRRYYELFAYFGMASWVFSTVFHTRDFAVTEQLDYFGAGASVLYGMYYALVRVARLDLPTPRRRSLLRLWTVLCCALYAAHVAYLKFWKWDYTYNMTANVVVGMVHNLLWTYFSWTRWRETRQSWAIWPSVLVAWVMLAMSLELLDFPPLWGALDAHSLWHLGTIVPTILWYNFMLKDSQDLAKTATLKDSKA